MASKDTAETLRHGEIPVEIQNLFGMTISASASLELFKLPISLKSHPPYFFLL